MTGKSLLTAEGEMKKDRKPGVTGRSLPQKLNVNT